MRDDSGFTLIELMVVIAIILILVVFLFPALAVARQRANDSLAAGYLRQAAVYMEQYNVDNATYVGATLAGLLGMGLQAAPPAVTLTVVDTSATGYCLTATHAGGSGITFGGTSQAITRTPCTVAQ